MKNKISFLMFAGLFALLLVVGFASAAVDFSNINGATQSIFAGNTATVTFQLTESGVNNITNISFDAPVTLHSGSKTLVSSSVSGVVTSLNKSGTSTEMTLTFNIPSNQSLGTYSGTLTFSGSNSSSGSLPISITVKSDKPSEIQDCINIGMPSGADVRIKKIDLNNNGIKVGSSSETYGDDNSWFPFENIEAQIEVKNYGIYDTSDVEVSWGLWNEDAGQWVIEPDAEKSFKLDHGDTESLTVNFQLDDNMDMDLSDLGDGDTLRFYVYLSDGVIDDRDAPSGIDGESFCEYDNSDAEMVIERDFVVINDLTLPDTIQCDSTVQISGTAWNVGDRDQNDVSMIVSNSQLGLSKVFSIGDIDSLDNAEFNFNLLINESTQAGTYYLKFVMVDEDGSVFQDDFNDDESFLNFPLVVTGDCSVPNVAVSASLQSGGQAGKPLVVKATIVNSGTKTATYTLNAAGYASWADSVQLDQTLLTLNAGETKDVLITLNVKSDASGDELFNLEVLSNGKLVANQPVSVSVEKRSGLTNFINKDNWKIWGIGLLNLILVIIIIVVAVRIARK